MRALAAYLKPYRKESILAPLFKLLEALFDLLVPLVVARMIDAGSGERTVFLCFAGLIAMAAVGLGCSVLAQYFAAKASVGFAGSLRQALFDHIQSLSYAELDRLGSDTLITRLSDDVNQVQNGLNMGLRLLLRSPFVVFGAMAMAFTIDVKCAWIYAVAIPILFAVVFAIMLVSIPLFKKVQSGLDRVTRMTRENLTGVRVIRAFCREERSVAEFDAANTELTRLNEFVGRISALLNPLTYVLINVAAVYLIDRAAIEVNLGSIAQGDVVALYNYMLQIIVELIKLASLIITLNKAVACAGRVSGVLAVQPGMSYPEESAVQVLRDAQFDVTVTYQLTDYQYDGLVISQTPASPSMVPIGSKITLVVGTVDNANVNGEATVTLQTTPPDLPGTVNVTAVLNGETVYSEVIEPRNTRLISIPLQGSGTCMADVLIDGEVYKSASVDFATGQYYWTADYSSAFGE